MSYVIYGVQKTRVTLYGPDGTTPLQRITLEKEAREGLTLSFKPEGPDTKLGSGANWAIKRTHHGFRAELAIKWEYGLESSVEAWVAGAWGAPSSILTALAISSIFTRAFEAPCLVEPHLDKAYSFKAQPDPGKPFVLKDVKGVAHSSLELVLIAEELGAIPDWAAL